MARTKRARTPKKAERKGRPRKAGERNPCGRLKVTEEQRFEVIRPVLEARCNQRGVPPSEENLRAMKDHREGYVLGRLLNNKQITEAEHDAGLRFQESFVKWARLNGIPLPNGAVSSYGLRVSGRSLADDDAAEAAQKQYYRAAAVLIRAGMLAEHNVKLVCLQNEEPTNVNSLRAGLVQLSGAFG